VTEAGIPRSLVAGVQTVEYLRAFLFGRLGWNKLGGNLIISGAFGLFRRDAVLAAGGYLHDTVGEDIELVVRMRRVAIEQGLPSQVAFVPDPIAWTEVPETLRVLGRQRDRWHRGLMDSLWRHRKMFLNPRYGSVGLVAFPYFFFVELLAPVIEAFGIIGLVIGLLVGAVNWPFAILFFFVAYGLGIIFSVLTIALDEIGFSRKRSARQRFRLLGWAFVENVGYRQLSVVWRLKGISSYLRGSREWGRMERKGFAATPPSTPTEIIKP
jgi:cellulose synthase/poly-beta-1,6-N-acetylglucosamine synthase-like glycosyltransferase